MTHNHVDGYRAETKWKARQSKMQLFSEKKTNQQSSIVAIPLDAPLVSNALDLFHLGYLTGSPLRRHNKEFLSALFLSAPSPMTWKQIVDATYQESPILLFRLVESLTEMINVGYVTKSNKRYSAHPSLFALLQKRFSAAKC